MTDSSTITDVEVLIVGAGFAGLGLAIQLSRAGDDAYLILERATEVGGTWRDNTYPGVACDIPSHLYSFSFRPNPRWSRVFSSGPEIQAYLKAAAEEEGVLPHVRFGADMTAAQWDSAERRWVVDTTAGRFRGQFLVMATGHLADEKVPPIPGLAEFSGELFHSARWRHDVDLRGQRVGVVGSGASAIQIVPAIAEEVEQLVVFQRSAPWVVPRPDGEYSAAQIRLFERDPESRAALREDLFWYYEQQYATRRLVEPYLTATSKYASRHLEAQVEDPELRRILTPDYALGCKRVLISNTFYPALTRSNVTVEPSALALVRGRAAVAASGSTYDLDVLVLATGFEASEPPFAHLVTGREGTLAERWSNGMRALDSISVHGFPNMFVLNGPNTSLGHNSNVFMLETQMSYVLSALRFARDEHIECMEATGKAESEYTEEMRRLSAGTVWLDGGCRNWYVDARTGELTVVWPDFAHTFRDRNADFATANYELVGGHAASSGHPGD